MLIDPDIPTWFICTECGETEKVTYSLPDGWYVQRNENSWDVYCPCINVIPAKTPEVDGSGYTRGGTSWTSAGTGTTTWTPTAFSMELYGYPPLKKKSPQQEKIDAALAAIEEEKAAQRERWLKWEEIKHSKHMDPTCEQCAEEIERIRRELKDYGKGNNDEN
jgi:hypothetical protein